MFVNILGTEYSIEISDLNEEYLAENDGMCFIYDKRILIRDKKYMSGETDAAKDDRFSQVLRHELIHAIAQECGVSYGDNEELVDWIAHIIPIVNKAMLDYCLDISTNIMEDIRNDT